MNIVITVVLVVLVLSFTNEQVAQAMGAFLMAGVIPGTSLQLPWYVTLLSIPLLLLGIVKLANSAKTESLPEPTPVKAPAKRRSRKTTAAHAVEKQAAKKKKSGKLPARRFTQLEA